RSATVEHYVGMFHLAVLIANPGVEIAAIDLVAGVNVLGTIDGGRASVQPTMDRAAVHHYRQRLSQLRDLIDEMETRDTPDRLAQASAEREWLLAELSTGTGIGGPPRPFLAGRGAARAAARQATPRAPPPT